MKITNNQSQITIVAAVMYLVICYWLSAYVCLDHFMHIGETIHIFFFGPHIPRLISHKKAHIL
jgi:uncharacterized membrane protein YwzB